MRTVYIASTALLRRKNHQHFFRTRLPQDLRRDPGPSPANSGSVFDALPVPGKEAARVLAFQPVQDLK
jgi:hypothetical protein